MAATEAAPAPTATVLPSSTSMASSSSSNKSLQPLTYVVIPLFTVMSLFLVGAFVFYRRRRRLRRGETGSGDSQPMEQRRHSVGTSNRQDRNDRWPAASLGMNWYFLRSNEGLNELGEAPPPYGVRLGKTTTEETNSASDDFVQEDNQDLDEEEHDGEERVVDSTDGRPSSGSLAYSNEERIRNNEYPGQRRNSEETLRSSHETQGNMNRTNQGNAETRRISDQQGQSSQEDASQEDASQGIEQTRQTSQATRDGNDLPLLLLAPRRQAPEEIQQIIAERRERNRQRRARESAAREEDAAGASGSRADVCTTAFFRDPSPDRSRRRLERLNRRLYRMGYMMTDSESSGFQLRDMENGAAPPGYIADPDIVIPPPARLPSPHRADMPPPYLAPAARRREQQRYEGPPMVRQSIHEQFPHHHYLFMPPLEHDYLVGGFAASLDMPRHIHSRF